MAYLYGDSTESSLDTNYLEFLRDALDFSVDILLSDYRVQTLQDSGEEHKRNAEAELQRLRVLSEKVNQLMTEPFGAPQSPVQRCAAQIRQGADDAIMRMVGQIKQHLSEQLAQVAGEVQRERTSPLRAIEMLLRQGNLPDTTTQVEIALAPTRTTYDAQVRGRADLGLEWVQALDIPSSHLFAHLVKVERLAANLEVRLPEKGGWRRKGLRVRAHRIGASYVTEVIHAGHQTTVKLRATPEEDDNGYNLLIAAGEPCVRLVQVLKGGEHSPPFEPLEEDGVRFLELVHNLTVAAADLSHHRGALREARIDGKPVGDLENPSFLVKRLVAKMTPVVVEIARHSLAPDELVLKRVLSDDRREEIFAAKADLLGKLEPVPIALRGVFAPLGLGDLGQPGPNSGRPQGPGDGRAPARNEWLDTSETVTHTKEIHPPPSTGEPQTFESPSRTPRPAVSVWPGDSRALPQAPTLTAAGRSGPANPAVRGMSPPPPPPGPARSSDPSGYPIPGSASPRAIEPSAGTAVLTEEDVTVVAEAEEQVRVPGPGRMGDDSIDVALSELEQES